MVHMLFKLYWRVVERGLAWGLGGVRREVPDFEERAYNGSQFQL